jgi:hypothetical protein
VALAGVAVVALAPAFFRPRPPTTAPVARRVNVPSPLLGHDLSPLQGRRLAGEGRLAARPGDGLYLDALHDGKPTLFALGEAHEPCFEFATEFRRCRSPLVEPPQEAGIFIGRHAGPSGPSPCLVVAAVDGPGPGGGAVLQALSWVVEARDAAREGRFSRRPLAGPEGPLTQVPLARPDDWHTLRIQVRKERVAIFVDDKLTWEFEAAKLQRHPRAGPLGPRGELGLWCRQAMAAYRNATLTALPPEEGGP